ncbi:hypothetical protein FKM82_005603 [Ascaphus truei]
MGDQGICLGVRYTKQHKLPADKGPLVFIAGKRRSQIQVILVTGWNADFLCFICLLFLGFVRECSSRVNPTRVILLSYTFIFITKSKKNGMQKIRILNNTAGNT